MLAQHYILPDVAHTGGHKPGHRQVEVIYKLMLIQCVRVLGYEGLSDCLYSIDETILVFNLLNAPPSEYPGSRVEN